MVFSGALLINVVMCAAAKRARAYVPSDAALSHEGREVLVRVGPPGVPGPAGDKCPYLYLLGRVRGGNAMAPLRSLFSGMFDALECYAMLAALFMLGSLRFASSPFWQ